MPLAEWENFYVIIGSSAAALTGLMFVAVALIADVHTGQQTREQQLAAFATPTVVHFGAVLMQSAILSAPSPTLGGAAVALGIYAWAAIIYMAIVVRRAWRQTGYHPVLEDWLFHGVLPMVGYLCVAAAVTVLPRYPVRALFVVGGSAVLLMSVGIHNAWDTVTYIVLSRLEDGRRGTDAGVERQGEA